MGRKGLQDKRWGFLRGTEGERRCSGARRQVCTESWARGKGLHRENHPRRAPFRPEPLNSRQLPTPSKAAMIDVSEEAGEGGNEEERKTT
jgi:hypothetical protein